MLVEAVTLDGLDEHAELAPVTESVAPPPPRFTPSDPPSSTQPIQHYPQHGAHPEPQPGRRPGPRPQPAFTGRPTPAAWALVGYSVLAVVGVAVDIFVG